MQAIHDPAMVGVDTPLQRYLRSRGVGSDAESVPKDLCPVEAAPRDRLSLSVRPVSAGGQMVRLSLPVPRGLLREGQSLVVTDGKWSSVAATRVLTWYPVSEGQKPLARRVIVTFPYVFKSLEPVALTLKPADESPTAADWPVAVSADAQGVTIAYTGGPTITAKLVAPARQSTDPPQSREVESNAMFRWQRLLMPDAAWPRVIETRVDALGTVTVVAHLQNWDVNAIGNERYFLTTPYLGWDLEMPGSPCRLSAGAADLPADKPRHEFKDGVACEFVFGDGRYRIHHPTAAHKRRGYVEVAPGAPGKVTHYRYLRATPWENVPMQAAGWRKAEFVVAPAPLPLLTATLEYPVETGVDWRLWDELYQSGKPLDLRAMPADLAAFADFHHDAVVRTMCVGDDWGDVTLFENGRATGMVDGASRLNHCPPIFEEGWRSGDRRLVSTAVLWCENFYDTSIYWGTGPTYGGSRYPSYRTKLPPGVTDQYQWRADSGGWAFTTKGASSFFMAYEQTGDPRMLHALDAQITYVGGELVPGVKSSTRMMGIVIDFIRLYRWTGRREYLDKALAAFRSFTAVLQPDHLFTEGGGPPTSNDLFVPHDTPRHAYKFYKPNNMGYALESLPDLLLHAPDEPRLRECVTAMADFMAAAQDPLGGWRYPHPRSPNMLTSHSMQHAHDMATVGRTLGPREAYLDAAERFLRMWFHVWEKSGCLPQSLDVWEYAVAKKQGLPAPDLQAMYEKVNDRDASRDYAEGEITMGHVAPEGLVYLADTLRFYLQHRPAERLLAPPEAGSPLDQVMKRINKPE
ncbi:MAG: glycoside hydrolase family 88 protein [Planctomycetes bacterium]|nr:glycoside hydrolase family 88 protein [Planctomycetota bacterium]